jgi:aryl-alcohol dehydrogenase-like predicted oxidoreductase
MAQISIAWILAKDPVSAPVVGTTSLQNLYDIIGGSGTSTASCSCSRRSSESVNVKLTDEEINYLEEPYQPLPVLGH